jgi:hypothetical protein
MKLGTRRIKIVEECWGRKESLRVDGCLERARLVP